MFSDALNFCQFKLFNRFCEVYKTENRINVAGNADLACCVSNNGVELAVKNFEKICGVYSNLSPFVVIIVRLNINLAVLNLYVENTLGVLA